MGTLSKSVGCVSSARLRWCFAPSEQNSESSRREPGSSHSRHVDGCLTYAAASLRDCFVALYISDPRISLGLVSSTIIDLHRRDHGFLHLGASTMHSGFQCIWAQFNLECLLDFASTAKLLDAGVLVAHFLRSSVRLGEEMVCTYLDTRLQARL